MEMPIYPASDCERWQQAKTAMEYYGIIRSVESNRKHRLWACLHARQQSSWGDEVLLERIDFARINAIEDLIDLNARLARNAEFMSMAELATVNRQINDLRDKIHIDLLIGTAKQGITWLMQLNSIDYWIADISGAISGRRTEMVDVEALKRVAMQTMRAIFGTRLNARIQESWRSSTVVDLAQAIYTERAFDRLPFLADALMDAGCDDDDMITHCQTCTTTGRGDWVIDLILGKS